MYIIHRVCTGLRNFGKVLEFQKLNSRPSKSMEFGVEVWNSCGLLEIYCQTACTCAVHVRPCMLAMQVFDFVLPCEISHRVGMGFAKVLEKFWNLARENPCEPCIIHVHQASVIY